MNQTREGCRAGRESPVTCPGGPTVLNCLAFGGFKTMTRNMGALGLVLLTGTLAACGGGSVATGPSVDTGGPKVVTVTGGAGTGGLARGGVTGGGREHARPRGAGAPPGIHHALARS